MKKIKLAQGKAILVDDEDYVFVKRFSWCLLKAPRGLCFYARNRKLGLLHRFIMGYPRKSVDHVNGDGLDNRKENLRLCTYLENSRNRKVPKGKYKGVFARSNAVGVSYFAYIRTEGRQIHLGTYGTAAEAALAYNKAASKYHGNFARLNEV